MDTLKNMRIFIRVVEAGGFSKAAEHEGVTTAQISRAITQLETRLRTRLLNRTTRRMSLTEAGTRYLQRCEAILEDVDQAETEAAGARINPMGTLKVYGGTGFGQHVVMPLIADFRQLLPEVSIDLTVSLRMPDMVKEGFDVSIIAAAELDDSALVSKRLGSTSTILCASPDYLATHGVPLSFDDLGAHTCLHLTDGTQPADRWVAVGPDGNTARHASTTPFQVNHPETLALALRGGMGVGPLPVPVALPALADGSLVRVLPGYRLQTLNIYALYASRRFVDAKIRTFVEFLHEGVPRILAQQEAALHALSEPVAVTPAAAEPRKRDARYAVLVA